MLDCIILNAKQANILFKPVIRRIVWAILMFGDTNPLEMGYMLY